MNSPGDASAAASSEVANPALVEVTRGAVVESRHRGALAIVDAAGNLLAGVGDLAAPVYPRSAVKCLQVLPLLTSGAAKHYGTSEAQLALACASHGGEPRHVASVRRWMAAIGLHAGDLRCGPHAPFHEPSAARMLATRRAPTPLHNNCSGKHVACLATIRYLDEDAADYLDPGHPAQLRIAAAMSELSGVDVLRAPCGTDGCGMPVRALPLRVLATAMARFAGRAASDPRDPCAVIHRAMTRHPWLVGGTGRFDTIAMHHGGGRFAAKMGAEGVHVAILPQRRLGIALKIEDGARRAADFAMGHLLHRLAQMNTDALGMTTAGMMPVTSAAGLRVGELRAAPALVAALAGL